MYATRVSPALNAHSLYAKHTSQAPFSRAVNTFHRRPTRAPLIIRAAKDSNGPRVAIAGVSGAVGQEFIRVTVASPSTFLSLINLSCASRILDLLVWHCNRCSQNVTFRTAMSRCLLRQGLPNSVSNFAFPVSACVSICFDRL